MKRDQSASLALGALSALAALLGCAPDEASSSSDSSSSSSSLARFGSKSTDEIEIALASTGTGGTTTTTTTMPAYCGLVFNFVTPIDGMQNYSSLRMYPRHDASTSWTIPTTPGQNTFWVYFMPQDSACPPSVSASQMLAYGEILVDGSTANIDFMHAFDNGEVTTQVHFSQATTTHTIKVVYPALARLGQTQHIATLTVNLQATNPFTYLQRSYSSQRCINCHLAGANPQGATDWPIYHPFAPPSDTPSGCEGCHAPFYNQYDPNHAQEATFGWMTPGAQKNMDWAYMTPLQRCQATTSHLPTAQALHDHFDKDLRLRWAVESGVRHDDGTQAFATTTSFPHNYQDFLTLADTWIDAGAPCANIGSPDAFGAWDVFPENDQ